MSVIVRSPVVDDTNVSHTTRTRQDLMSHLFYLFARYAVDIVDSPSHNPPMKNNTKFWKTIQALAPEMQVTDMAFRKWKSRGVPYKFHIQIIKKTGGKITANQLAKSRPQENT